MENAVYLNSKIKGQVEIKTKNKLTKIDIKNLSKKLIIKEEKYLNKKIKIFI